MSADSMLDAKIVRLKNASFAVNHRVLKPTSFFQ